MSANASGIAAAIPQTLRRRSGCDTNRHEYTSQVAHRVVARLHSELKLASARNRVYVPSQALAQQIAIARKLWCFRAFFDALPELLLNDPALRDRFVKLRCCVDTALQDSFEELIERGHMRPVEAGSRQNLSRVCWLLWLSWLRAENLANPDALEPSIAAIGSGLALIVTLWSPYFTVDLRELLKVELSEGQNR